MTYPFDSLVGEYARRWNAKEISPSVRPLADQVAKRLLSHVDRYNAVSKETGVPAAVIACIHEREASGRFDTYLGNGEPLNRVTRLVPKGRGPFATWEEGAIDALKIDGLDKVNGWTIERAAYEFETYNGWGYRKHGVASAYLWAGCNQYTGGKYVADGVFDKNAQDQQIGAMVLLECIMARSPSLALKRDVRDPATLPKPAPPPRPQPDDPGVPAKPKVDPGQHGAAATTGAAGGAIAAASGAPWWVVVGVVIVAAAAVYLIPKLIKKGTP